MPGLEALNIVGIHIEYSLLMRLDGEALFPTVTTATAGTPELLPSFLLALNPRMGLAFMMRPSSDRLCLALEPSVSPIWTRGLSLPLLSLLLFTCTAAGDGLPPHHDGLCFNWWVVWFITVGFDCTSSAATGG